MRTELCHFSSFKIYPGHRRRFRTTDGKSFNFTNKRCEAHFLAKKSPKKLTILYRRKHKKGLQIEISKKRTRRNEKFRRGVQGTTWGEILAKRNQKPEVRKAIKIAKEKKKATENAKKAKAEQEIESG